MNGYIHALFNKLGSAWIIIKIYQSEFFVMYKKQVLLGKCIPVKLSKAVKFYERLNWLQIETSLEKLQAQ